MTVNDNIKLFKEVPGTQHYIPIDGSLVRSGEYVYLGVNDNEMIVRVTRNGVDIDFTLIDGLCQIYVENCSDNYIVNTFTRIPLELFITYNTISTESPVFH